MSTQQAPTVARASLIMAASLLLSRILGVLRDQVMVWSFGRNEFTDAYRWSYSIPDLLFFLVAGGALSSAFIPVFSEYLHTDRKDEAWKVFSVVTTLMSVIVIGFVVFAWVFAYPLTYAVAPGSDADPVRELIATMSRIVLPAQFAFFIGGLMFGALYSHQRFTVPGLGPNVYNLGIIFGALVISQFVTPGVVGMSWGALIGATIGSFLVPLVALRAVNPEFRPSLDLSHPGVKKVMKLMLPVILGLSLPGVYGLIMQAFSSYYGKGTATAMDLSNKLMQAPLAVFGQSLAIAVFPTLSMHFAQKEMDKYASQLASTLRTVIYISVPVSALMIVQSPDIVAVLFQYGKRFGASDTAVVASCLQLFGVGVFAWCLHPVLMRGFFAIQNTVTPIAIGTATTAVFLGLCFGLRLTSLSYLSLPLASSVSAILLAVMLLGVLNRRIEEFDLKGITATFFKSSGAGLAMGLVLWMGALVVPRGEGLGHNALSLVRLFVFGLSGVWVYYGITRRLAMPETAYLDRTLAKLNRKRGA
ncbi:MAG: murein biosynthesis integral membrane protein MurJ [Armatimonadetes bacterium]|nr:murein biosynthesis integral membrane protein MurJ [Armatimonadota bacterium]